MASVKEDVPEQPATLADSSAVETAPGRPSLPLIDLGAITRDSPSGPESSDAEMTTATDGQPAPVLKQTPKAEPKPSSARGSTSAAQGDAGPPVGVWEPFVEGKDEYQTIMNMQSSRLTGKLAPLAPGPPCGQEVTGDLV